MSSGFFCEAGRLRSFACHAQERFWLPAAGFWLPARCLDVVSHRDDDREPLTVNRAWELRLS